MYLSEYLRIIDPSPSEMKRRYGTPTNALREIFQYACGDVKEKTGEDPLSEIIIEDDAYAALASNSGWSRKRMKDGLARVVQHLEGTDPPYIVTADTVEKVFQVKP